MSQLKLDHKYLAEKSIVKPSKITNNESKEYDTETQTTITRYKNLLVSKLFHEKTGASIGTTLPTGVNNGKKSMLSKIHIQGFNKDIISYPLEAIYNYLELNSELLKSENIKQVEVANIFGIKNLGTFFRIVKALGLVEKLEWKLINLPVKTFSKLNIEIKRYEIQYGKIEGTHIIEIGKNIGINNPEYLYTGISAIGIAKKYKIKKLKITKIELIEEIIHYIGKKYKKTTLFNRNNIFNILDVFNQKLGTNKIENITKLTGLLRYYGYDVDDIREQTH